MRAAIAADAAALGLMYYASHMYRKRKIEEYRQQAEQFAQTGLIAVPALHAAIKQKAVAGVQATMKEHIQSMNPSGSPLQGNPYSMAYKDPYEYPVLWELPDAQGMAVALMDPSFSGAVTFGANTCWQVRFLIGGFKWALFPEHPPKPQRSLETSIAGNEHFLKDLFPAHGIFSISPVVLEFDRQSWILPLFPSSAAPSEAPVPGNELLAHNLHFDSGVHGSYSNGVPCSAEDHIRSGGPFTASALLLHFISRQLSVQIHYANTTDIGRDEGVTAVLPVSHAVVLEALANLAASGTAVHSYADLSQRIKSLTKKLDVKLLQQTVKNNESLLLLGPMLHGVSRAKQLPADGFPRLCMNPKLWVQQDGTPDGEIKELAIGIGAAVEDVDKMSTAELRLVHLLLALPADSALCRLLSNPRAAVAVGGDDEKFGHMLQILKS